MCIYGHVAASSISSIPISECKMQRNCVLGEMCGGYKRKHKTSTFNRQGLLQGVTCVKVERHGNVRLERPGVGDKRLELASSLTPSSPLTHRSRGNQINLSS